MINKSIISKISQISGGAFLGQLVLILSSPVISRIYTPAEFGFMGLFASIVSVFGILSSLRYEQAIPIASDEDSRDIELFSVALVIITSIMLLLFITVLSYMFSIFENYNHILMSIIVSFGVLIAGLYQVYYNVAIVKEEYAKIGFTRAYQGAGTAVAHVGLGLAGLGIWGLVIGDVLGRGAGLRMLYKLRRNDLLAIEKVELVQLMMRVWRRFSDYPVKIAPATLISSVSLYAPYIIIPILYGPVVAGYFFLVQKVSGAPLSILGKGIAAVFYGRLSGLKKQGINITKSVFLRSFTFIVIISAIVALLASYLAVNYFASAFGSEWEEAGIIFALMAPAHVMSISVTPFSQAFNISGKLGTQLVVDTVRLILVIAVFFVAFISDISHTSTLLLYSASLFVSYSFHGIMIYRHA